MKWVYHPLLLGINQDYDYFKENELDQKISNFLLVSLDDDNFFMATKAYKEINDFMPSFGRYKEKIKGMYNIINKEVSQIFPNQSSKIVKKNTGFNASQSENMKVQAKVKKTVFSNQEETACEKVLEIFKDCLEGNIVNKIPLEPTFTDSSKRVCFIKNVHYNFYSD